MDFAEFLDQYGLPIAMLIALAVGRFTPGFIYAERKKEVEEANAEIKRLNEYVIAEVVPALSRQADVVEQAMHLLTEMREERRAQERAAYAEWQASMSSRVRQHSERPGLPPGAGLEG